MNVKSSANSLLNVLEQKLKRETLVSLPTIMQVEITSDCNLACSICARAEFPYGPGSLPVKLFKSLTPVFPYLKKLILHGYGEPLAHLRFAEIMDIVAPVSCEKSFYTNGTLLSGKRAQAVLSGGITEFTVSIDSPNREGFEAIRRGASFDRVISNVRGFIAERNKNGKRLPRVAIAAVAMADNASDLPKLVDLAAECGAEAVEINYLMAYKKDLVKRSLFFDQGRARAAIEAVERRARALGIEVRLPAPFSNDAVVSAPTPQETCLRPYDFSYIGYDGNVRPCCFPLLFLGTISEHNFRDIWNGAGYRGLRRAFARHRPPDFCRACLSGVYTDVNSASCHISCEYA